MSAEDTYLESLLLLFVWAVHDYTSLQSKGSKYTCFCIVMNIHFVILEICEDGPRGESIITVSQQ